MRRSSLPALVVRTLALLGLLGVGACNDDDNPTGPGTIGSSDQGTASALAYGVAVPIVQSLFLESYLDLVPAPGTRITLDACEPLAICSSGSAQICTDPGTLGATFTDCQVQGTALTGSLDLTITDPTQGDGTFNLNVGGEFEMMGTVGYTIDQDGFYQSFSNVVITTPSDENLVITMNGFSSWYEPRSMVGDLTVPSYAEFLFEIPSLNRAVHVSVSTEPTPGFMQVLVQSPNRFETYWICDGNVTGGSLSCTEGPNF
jgi:hypothetical protein